MQRIQQRLGEPEHQAEGENLRERVGRLAAGAVVPLAGGQRAVRNQLRRRQGGVGQRQRKEEVQREPPIHGELAERAVVDVPQVRLPIDLHVPQVRSVGAVEKRDVPPTRPQLLHYSKHDLLALGPGDHGPIQVHVALGMVLDAILAGQLVPTARGTRVGVELVVEEHHSRLVQAQGRGRSCQRKIDHPRLVVALRVEGETEL
mmetsp:Transcript_38538/g.109316  ORF Transcript_38538/g.109316 Transcript_38538/m.109316 type:complete len:203 (-) Transcript_38538:185-793(-)